MVSDQPDQLKVTVMHCGIIIGSAVAWIRHNTGVPQYGLANSSWLAAARGFRGGSITTTALATADTVHNTAGNQQSDGHTALGPRV